MGSTGRCLIYRMPCYFSRDGAGPHPARQARSCLGVASWGSGWGPAPSLLKHLGYNTDMDRYKERAKYGRVDHLIALTICLHDCFSLSFSTTHYGVGSPDFSAQDAVSYS